MVELIYADENVKRSLEKLEKKDKELFDHIKNALRNIKEDPTCGIKIAQRIIPREFIKKYEINNLYKYNLPNAWRLFYSLKGARIDLIAIILSCLHHKDYERLFNY